MRIAHLVSNLHPVEPHGNKGIYSQAGSLVDSIVERGHDVHLYAAQNSVTKAHLHTVPDRSSHPEWVHEDLQRHAMHSLISTCYEHADTVDIIHSHFTLLSSFYARLSETPTIISIHSPVREEIKPFLLQYRDIPYISFSYAQRKHMPELNWYANIYHGVDTAFFAYNAKPKDYVLYIGRLTEDKGIHFAIAAAKAAHIPLVIAGRSYENEGYWHNRIEKEIDGEQVRYIGELNYTQKIEWMQNAQALLFPSQYPETFGLVMIEAMACGTPVIGWKSGSVPEVVSDTKTGFVVESVEGMRDAILAIRKISREQTRQRAVQYFSLEKMTTGYLRVYERLIAAHKKTRLSIDRQ